MAGWLQMNTQEAISPVMEELMFFHDFVLVILTIIIVFVGYMLSMSLLSGSVNTGLLEGQIVESIWTMVPAVILVQLAVPSLILLYTLDEVGSSGVMFKAVGHQWYWTYEFNDFAAQEGVESYMLGESDSEARLLGVDSRIVLPYQVSIRGMISSGDVLHSWAVPALGVKADACPGRLNQANFFSHQPGVFFGQCSEICGANHSFMPIGVEFVSGEDFLKVWEE